MNEIVQADIFFFITAIAVVVVGVGMSIALCYIIFILRDVRAVTKKVRKASDELEKDFEDLRVNIKEEGVRVKTVFDLALRFIARHIPKSGTKRSEGREGQDARK